MDDFLNRALQLESLVSGVGIVATEGVIYAKLRRLKRVQWSYHAVPTAHGVLVLLSLMWPDNIELHTFSFAVVVATSLNVYNTLIPHVYSTLPYMIVDQSTVVEDILVPRYRPEFLPWGAVAQFAYSLMVLLHVGAQSVIFAHALRKA